jgi:hypothetical protein
MSAHPTSVRADPSTVGEIGGRSVVLSYAGVATEYEALRHNAIVIDRSHRGRMRLSGASAAEMLTGLVTNDVTALVPGQGQYAAGDAEGKDHRDRACFEDDFPNRCRARARVDGDRTQVREWLAPYKDDTLRDLGVFGSGALWSRDDRSEQHCTRHPASVFSRRRRDRRCAVIVARMPDPSSGFEPFVR